MSKKNTLNAIETLHKRAKDMTGEEMRNLIDGRNITDEEAAQYALLENAILEEPTELSKAVKVLCKALNTDEDYRRSWQANIAMAFVDEHDHGEHQSLHDVANNGAERFLNILTRDVK